jgi:outer membrane immunogenic protein
MKKLAIAIAAIAAIALIGTPVLAADLNKRPVNKAPPPPPPAPIYSWTGLYLGGHVGGVWANVDYTHINNGGVVEGFSQNASAVTGGIHGGGMYQWGNVVLGIEGTYSWYDLSATSAATLNVDRSDSFGSTNMATVVGRVGWAWDRWLVYGQGGWATAKTGFRRIQTDTNFTIASSSGWDDGWTVGAGVAYAIYNNIILGLEYDFARINIGDRVVLPDPNFGGCCDTVTNAHSDINQLIARLDFKFP